MERGDLVCVGREGVMGLTKALALLCGFIDVNFGRDDGPKLYEEVVEVCIAKVLIEERAFSWCSTATPRKSHLRQVVDEEVASLRALLLGRGWSLRHSAKHRAVGVGSVTLETSGVGPYGAI